MLHSFNTINLYKNCNFAYKLRYIKNQKLPITELKTIKGIILHLLLQQYFKPVEISEENKNKYLEFKLEDKKFYIKKNSYNLDEKTIKEIFEIDFISIIAQEFFQKIKNLKYKSLITELQLKDDKLIGTLDLYIELDGNKAIIIDYKSGNSYFSNMEQLYIYAVLVFEKFENIKEIMLISYYFNDNKILKHLFYKNEYKFYKNKLLKEIEIIENSKDFPKNKEHCNICFYKETCDNYTVIVNNLKDKNINFNSSNYLSKTVLLTDKPITDYNLLNKYLILNINEFEKENLVKVLKELKIEKIISNTEIYNKFTGIKAKNIENSEFNLYFKKSNFKIKVKIMKI